MTQLGNSSAEIQAPLETGFASIVIRPARFYLRLHRLPRSATRFINGRLVQAVERLARQTGGPPIRVRLTLRSREGVVRVALRVPSGSFPVRRLAPLARGAPASVKADCRIGLRGGTLSFTSGLARNA